MGTGGGPSGPAVALLAQEAYLHEAGIARYQLELIRGLAPRTNLHLLVYRKLMEAFPGGALPEELKRAKLHFYSAPSTVLRNLPRIIGRLAGNPGLLDVVPEVALLNVSTRLFAGVYCDRAGFALVHGTSSYLPNLKRRAARVITIHDVTPLTMPEHHSRTTRRAFVRPRDLTPDTEVVFDARSAMEDFLKVMSHPEDRCHVMHLGVDHGVFHPAEEPAAAGGGAPYIMSVGTIEPRKNLVRALAAFERVVERRSTLRWKVVGPRGWGWRAFSEALERSPARANVDVVGALPDATVADLYRGAAALLYPSLWEGFGLPVLEALACGTPVAASDLPVLREVAGDAFVGLNPADTDSIIEAVEQAAAPDARSRLATRGVERAGRFTWGRTVEGTLQLYARTLGISPQELAPGRPEPQGA